MVRIPPITDASSLPASYHGLFDRIAQARGGRMEGPYAVLLHSPAVAEKVDALATALRAESELAVPEFVLAALTVARAKDSLFVWSVQVANARRAGIAETTISAVRARTLDALQPAERDLVNYVQQLVSTNRVDQATFDRLRERHSERWLVELTVAAGNFELISAVNNALEVPPPADGDLLPV